MHALDCIHMCKYHYHKPEGSSCLHVPYNSYFSEFNKRLVWIMCVLGHIGFNCFVAGVKRSCGNYQVVT